MNDLPEQCRELAERFNEGSEVEVTLRVAADEIERLRSELQDVQR